MVGVWEVSPDCLSAPGAASCGGDGGPFKSVDFVNDGVIFSPKSNLSIAGPSTGVSILGVGGYFGLLKGEESCM